MVGHHNSAAESGNRQCTLSTISTGAQAPAPCVGDSAPTICGSISLSADIPPCGANPAAGGGEQRQYACPGCAADPSGHPAPSRGSREPAAGDGRFRCRLARLARLAPRVRLELSSRVVRPGDDAREAGGACLERPLEPARPLVRRRPRSRRCNARAAAVAGRCAGRHGMDSRRAATGASAENGRGRPRALARERHRRRKGVARRDAQAGRCRLHSTGRCARPRRRLRRDAPGSTRPVPRGARERDAGGRLHEDRSV